MTEGHSEYHDRLQKLKLIEEGGVTAYPDRFKISTKVAESLEAAEGLDLREVKEIVENGVKEDFRLAGRLMSFRQHGKISFAHLQDFSGKMQICFMEDILGKELYKSLRRFDTADHVGVVGELFRTNHGEVTLMVKEFVLLSKTLRPLPEKWHGLKDKETMYRQRYLETTTNRETMNRFIFRSDLVRILREFYWAEGFIEIETPVLETISSGATASPFMTHHNALDIDVYLRIAGGELWQKMALVGGFEKTFEVARVFRNEGIDPSHLQEFTMVEHYAAYWNYEDNMDFTERMFQFLFERLGLPMKVKIMDREGELREVDFKAPWPRVKFTDLIKKDCGIDVLEHDEESLKKAIKEKKIVVEGLEELGYGNLVDHLYKKVSRPKLVEPTFVIQHPVDMKPLARRSDEDPRLADTFQLLVNTWEVINAYGEIVDPRDQRARFEAQSLAKAGGDEEAMMMNEEYLLAMEHGMPCMSGWGMGIDRLVTLLTGQDNLKDCVMFPLMKPLDEVVKKQENLMKKMKEKIKKSKK
ncbi:lysine--tRNA ligase [Candidatus Gracilibacteria bacterium]|nr:lysine--tRNA ligase [Candidatus Gracilibacteria bacterium]